MLMARTAVAWSFVMNGFSFASWVSRIPEVRGALELSNGRLGLLLLAVSAGSVATLPTSGALIHRFGARRVVRVGAGLVIVGLLGLALGADVVGALPPTALALLIYGMGIGMWDVAMNVEGAGVEQHLRRTIMPRFHAGFSLGTVLGAVVGAASIAAGVPMLWHLTLVALVAGGVGIASASGFVVHDVETGLEPTARRSAWAAWREPRTLLIGLMVMSLTLTEGTANDWLAIALIDGYQVEPWMGVAGFGIFVSAMTLGRLAGPGVLDRFGRTSVLWMTMVLAGLGVIAIVVGGHPVLVVVGIVFWGVGASLGFPVGMSAASDDPTHAAARVSVVSSIAYTAFLAGPPLFGFLAEQVGARPALLAVAVLLIPSALVVPSARRPDPPS